MQQDYIETFREALQAKGVAIEDGLTEAEIDRIEASHDFSFPPDLRFFLAKVLPVSQHFPNWRDETDEELRWRLDGPTDGIVFDVEANDFWIEEWGPRPERPEEAAEVARFQVSRAPKLVPIFGHRYLPSDPSEEGNPVLSVVQTDIIYVGHDLADYFHKEFGVPRPAWSRSAPRQIKFWSSFINGIPPG